MKSGKFMARGLVTERIFSLVYFNVNTNCQKYCIGDTKTAKNSNFSKKYLKMDKKMYPSELYLLVTP
jgi:hypothetical protein